MVNVYIYRIYTCTYLTTHDFLRGPFVTRVQGFESKEKKNTKNHAYVRSSIFPFRDIGRIEHLCEAW